MIAAAQGPRRCLATALAVLVSALAALALVACSGAGSPGSAPSASLAPSIPTPLASSLQTAAGTWATVPMGRLDEPLNTFWQLFFRRAGSASWSNQVQATAVATNGGLVLASPRGRALLVGVRPSQLLSFSPLIYTADGARSWSTGLLPAGLAARPDALAADSSSRLLALVGGDGGAQVLASRAGPSAWRAAITGHALAASAAGRACGLGALTAVAYLGDAALVGGSCARAGVVGIFLQGAAGWRLVQAALPSSLERGRVEVLSLQSAGAGASALLAVTAPAGLALLAAWEHDGRWRSSQPLALVASERISSFGPASGGGVFVLLNASSGSPRVAVASGPGAAWRQLSPPPAGTATVAFGPAASVDALAVREAALSVWALAPRTHHWVRAQVIDVPIELGSSG